MVGIEFRGDRIPYLSGLLHLQLWCPLGVSSSLIDSRKKKTTAIVQCEACKPNPPSTLHASSPQFLSELVLRHRRREHTIRASRCGVLPLGRRSCSAIGQCNYVETLFIGSAHGGFHATVGQEAAHCHRFDAVFNEEPLKVGARKSVEALFAFDCKVTCLGFHRITKFCVPSALHEEFVICAAGQDAKPFVWIVTHVLLVHDGGVDDCASFCPGHVGQFRRLRKHVRLFHHIFHRVMQLAALGSKLILILNEEHRRFRGNDLVSTLCTH